TRPSVTINQKVGQADPTNSSPIDFTVTFSESVTGFTASSVSLSGTAGATTKVVTGSGTTYNVAVSGMTSDGTVIATVLAGGAADAAGNTNTASTSTDNNVLYDTTKPVSSATSPAYSNTTTFTVTYTATDAAPASGVKEVELWVKGPGDASYSLDQTDFTPSTPSFSFSAGAGDGDYAFYTRARDNAGNYELAPASADSTTHLDTLKPDVTIDKAAAQADPTNTSPINFTVVFSESVTGFDATDVSLSGTAGATTKLVTGSGTTYNVAVSGMT